MFDLSKKHGFTVKKQTNSKIGIPCKEAFLNRLGIPYTKALTKDIKPFKQALKTKEDKNPWHEALNNERTLTVTKGFKQKRDANLFPRPT